MNKVEFLSILSEREVLDLLASREVPKKLHVSGIRNSIIFEEFKVAEAEYKVYKSKIDGFNAWVSDKSTDAIAKLKFRQLFSGLTDLLDRESRTSIHISERNVINNLLEDRGFAIFSVHYERAIRKVYNYNNYRESHDGELNAEIETRRGEIVKDVITAIADALPKK